MRVVISESDGTTYSLIGLEPLALWPDDLPMTESDMERVADAYQGTTLSQADVMRIVGN